MPPDISVVIPTFRRPRELAESLDSALSQQSVSLEVVVVDDSPEGSAAAVVEHFFASAARKAATGNRLGRRWGFTAYMLFDIALLVCSAAERCGLFDGQVKYCVWLLE